MQERRVSMPVLITVAVLCFCFTLGALSVLKSSAGQGSFFNGSWTSSFETVFDNNLAHYKPSLSFWNKLNHALFKEGKEGVLIGEDGWLFTTEEFDHPKGFEKNIQNNLTYILKVKEKFFDLDVDLIVVPVPSKARLLEDKLGQYSFPKYRQGVYNQLLDFLSNNKITSFNLLSKVDEAEIFFLKTDTHWSSAGAELAAENASKLIPQKLLSAYKQKYSVERRKQQSIEGDLTRYGVKSTEDISVVELMGGGFDDLFDDVHIPITLVGTSYSANKNWGFESWLKYYLQVDVLNMADEGLGPFEVMENYLNSDELEKMKPKLVIWEMPERYLPVRFEKNTK